MVLVAAAVWSSGVPGPYQFDDRVTPLGDPASQSLRAWSSNLSQTLRPLTKLTYAAEASLGWSETPAPRRALNILFHGVSAALLFVLILGLAPGLPSWMAFAVALMWAVHPIHAENVLQVCGRTVVLSNLLVISSLLAAVRRRLFVSALLFIFAGLARETALACVLSLLVLGALLQPNPAKQGMRRLAPLILATLFLTGWYATTDRYWDLAEYSLLGRPLVGSAAAQVAAVPIGFTLLFRPDALSVDYGVPLPDSVFSPGFGLGAAYYFFAAMALWFGLSRSAPLAVGAAVWLAAVLPTQSVIPKLDPLTSRPLSLALAGLLVAAMPLAARAALSRRRIAVIVLAISLGLAVWLAVWTQHRAQLYSSELLLWEDAASKSVANPRPHFYYALLLNSQGRFEEARRALYAAQEIDPFDSRIAALFKQLEQRERLE